jgi:eukaryotic translation elongation factor 1 epsilon-1
LELDSHLSHRSYLVGQSLSIADLSVFFAISDIMAQLSPIEKEKYINLSRWYDHLQLQEHIRQDTKIINFATIHLFG